MTAADFPHPFNSREVKFRPPGNWAKASQRLCESIIRERFRCPRKGGDVRIKGGDGPRKK
jgi:hypothetical protein